MKKVILFLSAMTFVVTGFAQKKNIQSASNSLRHKEYKEAIEFIEKAVSDPSTKDDAKAWFVRGSIFMAMEQDPGYANQGHYKKAAESYFKVLELKPGYETNVVSSNLIYAAYKDYNTAVNKYNAKSYDESYAAAKSTVDIHSKVDGENFVGNKSFDTVAAGALVIQAYSAFYNEQPDKALPVLLQLKDNPIEGNANIYLIISDVYRKKGDQAKELAIIEEAKKKYPGNANVRNEELNYYIRTNQQDKLIAKLETAVADEPGNAVYQYNLANAYTNMAFQDGVKPENYDELITKAEQGFDQALELDPENVGYHYDIGVLYFNQASKVTDEMNNVPVDDDATYNELKTRRDGLFDKAFPHLEQVYIKFGPRFNELDTDNKSIYVSSLRAMREIYARQDKLDKAKEIKAKIDEANK